MGREISERGGRCLVTHVLCETYRGRGLGDVEKRKEGYFGQ